MIPETKEVLKKRLKSLGWRVGGVAAVGLLSLLLDPQIAEAFKLPQIAVVLVGLVINEISKQLNSSK